MMRIGKVQTIMLLTQIDLQKSTVINVRPFNPKSGDWRDVTAGFFFEYYLSWLNTCHRQSESIHCIVEVTRSVQQLCTKKNTKEVDKKIILTTRLTT